MEETKGTPGWNIMMVTRAEDLGNRYIFLFVCLKVFKSTVSLDETGRTLERQDSLLHLQEEKEECTEDRGW